VCQTALLDFETPRGLQMNVSSLASPNFATSYTIGSVGVVHGSVSYLHSSTPLTVASKSTKISLRNIVPGYRHLQEIRTPDQVWWWEVWHGGKRVDQRGASSLLLVWKHQSSPAHLEGGNAPR